VTTALDLIERVYLRATAGVSEAFVQFAASVNASTQGATDTVQLSGAQIQGISVGSRLSSGLEIMLVTEFSTSTNVAQVIRGYNGSQATSHALNDIVYLNPEFTYFDILTAINDDLDDISGMGLVRLGNANVTYVPVFQGFDLGVISSNYIEILNIRYQEATPVHRLPRIYEFDESRNLSDSYFPSGQGVVVYEGGFAGKPMMIQYAAPFLPLVNLTDSVTQTPTANDPAPPYNTWGTTTTVANLPQTATDIPVLGALYRLTQPREIQRNDMGSQPEPRKAQEVPFGSVAGSVNPLLQERARRIGVEIRRQRKQIPQRRR
jgi:hypothetical protein